MSYTYNVTRLPNGARIASVEMPHMRSATVGVWAGVGGRHERVREGGISHFIEHLLFKGTKRRNPRQITAAVEGVGGYLNAFTTEDHTCYYAKAGAPHFERVCDVLTDMYVDSVFAKAEIDREREVIREEILMYRDQPAQHAQELLTSTLWPRHPLGRPLTGTVETVSHLGRKEIMEFHRNNYNGSSTVVTVAGRVPHEQVVKALGPALGRLPAGKRARFQRSPIHPGRPSVNLHTHETEQTHLAMGFHTWGRRDERRFALKILSVILGENMSSRLFQKLRERHAFCYSVSSGMVTLADTGALHISAGLDPAKLEPALRMILREIAAIAKSGPTRAELKMAQDYTIGQTLMGLESTTNQIMWMGESLLGYGRVLCPMEIEQRIMAVTRAEVQAVAGECLKLGRLGIAVVGPLKDAAKIESWLR
ncbi:peptidase M16 [Verrucomicrobiota bacterium]|jgi:predicted Zn-dependent peptidase|nr:peptidase M16 [Verrucomicrobiota bacterium]